MNQKIETFIIFLYFSNIILFATTSRFPGVSMKEIQEMLLEPALEIVDAINLDGGGSSQMYLAMTKNTDEELFIFNGDEVPVALAMIKK